MKDNITKARAGLEECYKVLATYADLVADSGDRYVLSKELNALLNPDCYTVDQLISAVEKIQDRTGIVFDAKGLAE